MQSLRRTDLCKAGQRSMSWTLQVARLEADLRIPICCITISPPLHLIKPTPWPWFWTLNIWTFENEKKCNVTGQNLRFPWLSDYLQIHIRLTYQSPLILSASEFVWLSCEWWNFKSYVDVCNMWKTTPRFSALERPEVCAHILIQPNRPIRLLCTHSTSLDTH